MWLKELEMCDKNLGEKKSRSNNSGESSHVAQQ